jgi:all-trans-8'-apo-beta-carotenal 15,15'-oxygenase
MQRREFMQFLSAAVAVGASVPGLSFAEQTDPLRACAERFAAARKKHAVLAGWQSAPLTGLARTRAEIKGRWPKELRGRLYRNGPGNFERGGQRYLHWFDGDGLLQCWDFRDGSVQHSAQFVQTPKFKRESKSERFEVMAAGTTIPNARAISGPDDANTANISVLHLAGKSYALWEAGSAFAFDRDSLATTEIKSWRDDLEGVAFSAHPVYERDGSVWNVGALGSQMVIYHLSATGELLQAQLVSLPRSGYMHSFTASESKLVFVFAPMLPEREAGSFFEQLAWRPELGSLMVIVPKSDLSKPTFIEFEAGAAYHYADAWDRKDGGLCVRACWDSYSSSAAGFISPMQHYMQGTMQRSADMNPALTTLHVDIQKQSVRVAASGLDNVEFPIQTKLMRQSDLLLLQGYKDGSGLLKKLLLVDGNGKTRHAYDGQAHIALEEHVFVPQNGKRFAVGTVLDTRKARTGIYAFDLERLGDGPVAQAWLPYATPLGFHGSYLPA